MPPQVVDPSSGSGAYSYDMKTRLSRRVSVFNTQTMDYEERVQNAIASVRQGRHSARKACEIYGVSRSTLIRRMNGVQTRTGVRRKSHRLTSPGEFALIQHIKGLDDAGFPLTISALRDAANFFSVLPSPVGKHWVERFLDKQPELKFRFSRSYDYQLALRDNPTKVRDWFDRYSDLKAEHEVSDIDVYNMDESWFQMGQTKTSLVVAGPVPKGRWRKLQPGSREWITTITCIGAGGHTVPPLLVVKSTDPLERWYTESDLPDDWLLSATENGWTNNNVALNWLKHFDKHTVERARGQKRMLILDGHESHMSVAFREYCEENKIILVCLPSHSSHILQPLDAGFFSVLKRAYSAEVDKLARNFIMNISKTEFFPAFRKAYERSVTESNIAGCFEGAGLIPYCPDVVINNMNMQLRQVTPPSDAEQLEAWQSEIPRDENEWKAQCALVARRIHDPELQRDFQRLLAYVETVHQQNELLKSENRDLKEASSENIRRRGGVRLGTGTMALGEGRALLRELRSQDHTTTSETRKRGRCGTHVHNKRRCRAPLPVRAARVEDGASDDAEEYDDDAEEYDDDDDDGDGEDNVESEDKGDSEIGNATIINESSEPKSGSLSSTNDSESTQRM